MKTVILTKKERQKTRGWLLTLVKLPDMPKWEADILRKVIKKLQRKDPPTQGVLPVGGVG